MIAAEEGVDSPSFFPHITCPVMYQRFFRRKPKVVSDSKLPKEPSLPSLKKTLTKVFNKFIRERDTLVDPSGQEYFICISCDKPKPTSEMHAGHFIPAGSSEAIRWDERNVNGQCRYCNTYLHGNPLGYEKGMLKKWGQAVIDALRQKKNNVSKWHKFEVTIMIEQYRKRLKK